MPRKRYKPEEIVAKVDVLVSQGTSMESRKAARRRRGA